MSSESIGYFFALAPLVMIGGTIAAAYAATRHQTHARAPIGKTYACARCGKRRNHEHMLPSNREGAIVWFCERCAGDHADAP